MSRVFQILYLAVITFSVVLALQNQGCAKNTRQPFSVAVCEELCNIIRDCSSATFNQDFLQHLILKVTRMSDLTVFQLSTQYCYSNTTNPKTRGNRARGNRNQQKGTLKRSQNTDWKCKSKQHGYRSVRAGRDTIIMKLHTEPRTWDGALKICQSEGALLAVPNTKEKEHAMMRRSRIQLGRIPGGIWIGLRDIGQNNMFVWMDGSPLSYTNWHDGEPTHTFMGWDEDCAIEVTYMKLFVRVYGWNDANCLSYKAFFCQCS